MDNKKIPVPHNEKDRVAALKRYNILDTLPQEEFDNVAKLVSYICEVPIAHISFLDENRQWFKSLVGFEAIEVAREETFCQYTIMGSEIMEIPDTHINETFKDDPNVKGGFKVRFYAGIPITTPDGYNIGTICAIDHKPKHLNDEQKKALATLAKHIITLLELHDKNAQLDKQTKIAEMAVRAKDSFLANMSHEIRTPLNAINGFTDLLAQSHLDSTQKGFVTNIQMAGENLMYVINDILDLSKIESGKLAMEAAPFNIKTTLKHVYDLLKVKVPNTIEFNLFLDADMPEIVVGDKARMNQIMVNLAGNAIKFTHEGDITISVKKVDETDEKYRLKFSVKDTGIGIGKDNLDSIFERFTQAEESTTREYGGTGLGLNIVKQLIELQGGEIYLKSEVGRGSEFYFLLDFEKVELVEEAINNNIIVDDSIHINDEEALPDKVSILLCEDNVLNQSLAKSVIKNFGFNLDIANNGQEGIEMLSQNDYDIILMDLQMPVKDGYETSKYIREELKSHIPIIAMTAHSLVGEQQKCYDMGMDGYVPKPFKQDALLKAIRLALLKNTENPDVITQVDFSYLNEMSGGSEEFLNEMITLFIAKMPGEINNLGTMVSEHNHDEVKKIIHNMRSSLSLFKLEALFSQLNCIDDDAENFNFSKSTTESFDILKRKVLNVIDILKNKLS